MKRIYTLFALICLCALFLTLTNYYRENKEKIAKTEPEQKSDTYLLISEDETVRLYYGKVLLKTYNNIVLSALPPIDRDNLKSGMILENYEDVQSLIEDFDG